MVVMSLLYVPTQHQAIALYCLGDNNFVKKLSNFHSPVVLRGGMRRKKRDRQTKRRDREFSDVDCPIQQKDYCETYHLIDKGKMELKLSMIYQLNRIWRVPAQGGS
jgi:hypothetical protein